MNDRIDKTLNIKGVCSLRPGELTLNILRGMISGQVLQVITNEGATRQSIPELCRENGYAILETREENGTFYFTIRV